MLIKGANRHSLDLAGGKPEQFVNISGKDNSDTVASEILDLLQDKWSFFGDFLMIRATFKKQEKSARILILYFVLMSSSFMCIYSTSNY